MKPNYLLYVSCTILAFSIFLPAYAQMKITGTVHDVEAKAISNTSVLLLNAVDSNLIKGTTSNAEGLFTLEKLSRGSYIILCTNINYEDQYSKTFTLDKEILDFGSITLSQKSEQLKEVTVNTKKPMFEQKIDRMVINVKNSIRSAGGTVLEVLEKSPGVIVNRASGAVSMNGKDGVMVMINGKINYMPQDAVLQMLNGINASNVEKIELITTPPAKFDAGGNAGYINVVLVTNPNEGFNGSYSLSMGVGNGTIPTANTNFNYRKKNTNIYGSYSFSRIAQKQTFENYRSVINQGDLNEIAVISNRNPFQRNHNARLGLDYKIGKRSVIGGLISGYDNKWSMNAINTSISKKNFNVDTSILIDNNEINHWKHAMGNLNLQHNIKEGEEFSINTDYLYYHNTNPTLYLNSYYDGSKNFLFEENTASGKKTIINIWVSQFDYSKKLNDKTNLQGGAKASFSRFTNDVLVQRKVGNDWLSDPDFTNNYFLKENIGAAYLSIDKNLNEKTSLKTGLRYEYTTTDLGSETEKNIVNRKYGRLFPTFYISRQLNDNNHLNFTYSRRITRPAFTQLAPFLIFFDPKTFISGNSALQPAIADAVKVDFIVKKFVFSASYSYESNTIARFQNEVDTVTNKQTTTPQNMDNSKLFYVSASLPVQVTKWWFSQLNVAANWNKLVAVYKEEPIIFSQVYYTLSGAQTFTLPQKFSVELSGFFQSKAFLFGSNEVEPFGSLNAAVQKKFNNSSLTFGVDNVFNSMKFKTSFSIPDQNIETSGSFLFFHRLYKLTWSKNFGNKVLKDKRTRGTASDEERLRVQ